MSGHTPGPWRVEPSHDGHGGELFAIGASYQWPEGEAAFVGLMFTPVKGVGPYAAHRESDARLAAAAPELLEACKRLYDLMPDCDGDFLLDGNKGEFALKAIRVPGIGEACLQARAAIAKAEGREP